DRAAISTFLSCTGSSVTVDYVAATKPLPSEVDPEVAADVEVVAALAPKATVVLFESNQAGTGLGPWQMAVSGDGPAGLPDVVSSSWGSCEPQTGLGSSYYAAEETIFEEAAAQGQTVLVASGDDGSEGCYYESENGQLAVDDPASAPYVTAVGGTASDTQSGPEYVWNSHDASAQNCLGTGCWGGASGGGASAIWPRPSYQPDDLPPSPACALGVQGCREIPDVSAMAGDPYAQYCTVCGGGAGWVGLGGTSLSAPSWGTAVLLSENICPTKVGFLNPLLYADPSTLTGPITSGNNDLTGSNQGDYSASPTGGYSMAGGLGYLGGTDLSGGALCGAPEASPAPAGAPNNGASGPGANSASSLRACTKPADHPLRGAPVALAAAEEAGCAGYWALSENGAVASFGAAINFGSTPKLSGTTAVAIAATPDYYGYWVLTANGRVYPFGDASSFGSPYKQHPKAPLVALAPTPDGNGYWLAAADGSVFAYGDARFYGSLSGHHLNQPVIGLTVAPGGQGYWLIAADGGVFELGRARFFGSLASTTLREPVVSASSPAGSDGYWVVGADGGVFSFGAHFYGSLGSHPAPAPVQAIATSVDGKGYYLMDAAGHVYAYGDARYLGNAVP
ncbi:MAG TPA: hypothetical protein VK425_05770, partial [Acidimicrobiales bacterium]|nr:hypothetical protein [Acidimicrobiales bacterium]